MIGAMTDRNVARRLYFSTVVVVCLVTIVAPFYFATSVENDLKFKYVRDCDTDPKGEIIAGMIDSCVKQAYSHLLVPVWQHWICYLPAMSLLWLSWIFSPQLHFSDESYPRRTIGFLTYLFLVFAVFVDILIMWNSLRAPKEKLDSTLDFLVHSPYLIAAPLFGLLLFEHLLRSKVGIRKSAAIKSAIVFVFVAPFATIILGILKAIYTFA